MASGSIALSDVDNASFSVTLTAPIGTLTSGGQTITWAGAGTSTLVGSIAGRTIVTATINNSGAYTVTLSGPIDHATAGVEDLRSFNIGISVSDGSAVTTSSLTVNVEDDSPLWTGTPLAGAMSNDVGTVLNGTLGLAIGADNGSSAKVSISGSVDGSGFATGTLFKADGTSLGTSNLTYNGSKLVYTQNVDGSVTARDVATSTAIFTASGNAAAGTYQVTMHQTLDAPGYTTGVFGSLNGGNGGVYTISDGQNAFQLLMTGYAANGSVSTVNTSANTIGVGAGQDIDTGERLRMEFNSSTGANAPMSSITVTTAKLGSGETLTWTAFDAAGLVIGSGSQAGASSGVVTLTIGPSQLGNRLFDTVEFSAGAGSSYKLTLSSISGQSDALDVRTAFTVGGTDADGDVTPTTQTFNVLFDSNTVITGTASADALAGGAAAETFSGGAGADLITGGGGNDTMTGGTGADVFKWSLADKGAMGNPARDTITDFDPAAKAAGGDVLDLRDLLQGETSSASLQNYLDFSVSGGNTVIRISSSGGFTGGTYASGAEDERITLTGVSLDTALGLAAGASDALLIAELINRAKLVTDVPPGG